MIAQTLCEVSELISSLQHLRLVEYATCSLRLLSHTIRGLMLVLSPFVSRPVVARYHHTFFGISLLGKLVYPGEVVRLPSGH
jgi:hypothetical protein